MKKYLGLLLVCLLLIVGCAAAAEEAPPLCGVVLVSDSMGGDWSVLAERRHLDAVLYGLDDEWRDIAMDVSDERVVEIVGGRELYLILPMDADATVSVVHLSDDEEKLIYRSEAGEPFLLRSNIAPSPWEEDPYLSDFEEVTEPFDCRILIVDSMDNLLIWNPYVSFNRGEVNTDAQGGGVNAAQLFQMGAQQQTQAQPVGNDWKCACGAMATGKFCPECGAKKPAEDGWICSCGAVNKGKFCAECGSRKPAGAPIYQCDKCGWKPADPTKAPRFCPECGDPFDEGDIQ